MERIQKLLSQAGIASRRKAEELIRQGKVTVNGKKAEIGMKASAKDEIKVDGEKIEIEKKAYYKFYKPKGYVTTMGAEHGAKTIKELIAVPETVFPVGRLDKDAEGLIILTNDGEWANKISHPRYETKKEYEVKLDRPFTGKLEQVMVEGRQVESEELERKGNKIKIRIHEGRKHIVKKIFKKKGYKVQELKRTKIDGIELGRMKPGETKEISKIVHKLNNEKRSK